MSGDKYLRSNSTTGVPTEQAAIQSSAGAGSAGKIPALDAAGKFDTSMMPVGIVAPTATVLASEALSAGDLVNVWNNAGTANVRKADASTTGKQADGFVLAAVLNGASATVFFPGDENTAVTGLTPGRQFLSDTTPGASTTTVPTTAGHLVQPIGTATSATVLIFEPQNGYVLA